MGGDWNATWDRSIVTSNIDVFQMAGLPNAKNSEYLENLANEFSLTDPFRILYPDKRDYTYSPFGSVRLNRSRLDFFVMSSNLVPYLSDCSIESAPKCKLFDHKTVTLFLFQQKPQKNCIRKDAISNSFLKEHALKYSVEIASRRAHLLSLDQQAVDTPLNYRSVLDLFNVEMGKINVCINTLKLYTKSLEKTSTASPSEFDILESAALDQRLSMLFDDMAPLSTLESLVKRCSHREFFEAMVKEIRSYGSKTQRILFRNKKLKTENLTEKLKSLKLNYAGNSNEIFELENRLRIIMDCDLRERAREIKLLECLHAEKATPLLVDLAKRPTSSDSLENIKDDAGGVFDSGQQRAGYIRDFYEKLYQTDHSVGGDIETFLGPAIAAHPTVLGSKLTVDEKNNLDSPLTVDELDRSLKMSNMRSAPGVDGFSYRFISEFWNYFRIPLFNCASEGLENSALPDFFRTAIIKLIPKKGDTGKISNWRPISLLSNFYKIISRAINIRLQGVVDRVLSRAQKGFTKSRQIQEVIINCMETMDYCVKNNIKGVLVSIDQSKAFDSVSHAYMEKVYDFFGFGDRIKRWLKSIGTGRNACIQLGPNLLSDPFNLGRGHAQGDSPSPILYNLAAQIQIFRIELDPLIESVGPDAADPILELAPPHRYKGEGLGQTKKNESFADDSSNLVALRLETLSTIKQVLDNFKKLSGLSCNLEKSFVMRIGDLSGEISQSIRDLGFAFRDKITLLGFTLQNYGDITATNFERISSKIDGLIRFWDRFFLSLPGKIVVYKTFLIPQLNYIASILTPSSDYLEGMEKKLQSFVTKGLSIAKKKIYAPVKEGGLGLFILKDFIASLQCNWIKRSFMNINDNWRYELAKNSGGNILDLVLDRKTNDCLGTVLKNIASSYCYFKCQFTRAGNNFLTVPIYCNAAIGYGRGYQSTLDDIFFQCEQNDELRATLRTVTWSNLIRGNGEIFLRPREEINLILGTLITNQQYNTLANTLRITKKRYYKEGEKATTIRDFMNSFKKGSKYFRKYVSQWNPKDTLGTTTQVKTFLQLIDCPPPGTVRLQNIYSNWNNYYYTSNIRVFLFKYYNNILGINSRVAHFNPDINGACTFCSLAFNLPAPKESFVHLFYDCAIVNSLIRNVWGTFIRDLEIDKTVFFLANYSDNENYNRYLGTVLDILRFHIWQAKLEKKNSYNTESNSRDTIQFTNDTESRR